jgi:cell division transport system permease protein
MIGLPGLFRQGIRDVFRTPWALCLTIAAVGLVAFLAGMFLMLVNTLEDQILRRQAEVQFQVYWKQGSDLEQVRAAWRSLDQLPGLLGSTTFTPDAGLDVLAQAFEDQVDLQKFKTASPLPPTALVTFALPDEDQNGWSKAMLARLKSLPLVDKVHYNPLHIDLVHSWMRVSNAIFWPVICFLILVVGLVVGNTIKLALFQRRDEIEILRLVGASRLYIRFPLIVGGGVQGLMGGLLALGLLGLVHMGLQDMLYFPPLWIEVPFLSLEEIGGMLGVLMFVGIVSSFVAVKEG